MKWICQHGSPWGGFCQYCPGGVAERHYNDIPDRGGDVIGTAGLILIAMFIGAGCAELARWVF